MSAINPYMYTLQYVDAKQSLRIDDDDVIYLSEDIVTSHIIFHIMYTLLSNIFESLTGTEFSINTAIPEASANQQLGK